MNRNLKINNKATLGLFLLIALFISVATTNPSYSQSTNKTEPAQDVNNQELDLTVLNSTILTQNRNGELDSSITPFGNETSTFQNGTFVVNDEDIPFTFERKGSLNIMDGDVLLSAILEDGKAAFDTFTDRQPWTSGIIPIVIDSNVPDKQRIYAALDYVEASTPLAFKPVTVDEDGEISDKYYMRIVADPSADRTCYTFAGMLNRDDPVFTGYTDEQGSVHKPFYTDGEYHGQPMVLSSDCRFGTIVHEFGHVAGMHHEQKRADRDQYVTIVWENIPDDWRSQYQIIPTDNSEIYDYCSIMHYPRGNPPVIIPKFEVVGCEDLGQREGYSPIDIAAIKSVYPFE